MKKPAFTLICIAIAALTLLARLERQNKRTVAGDSPGPGSYPTANTDKKFTPKK